MGSSSSGCRVMVSEGFLRDAKIDPAGGKTTVLDPKCVGQGLLVITQVGYSRQKIKADSPFIVGLKSRNQLAREGVLMDEKGQPIQVDYDDTGYIKVNRDHPNYIYFRAPFTGKLSGNEKSEFEVAESLYDSTFMTAAQIKEITGKTPEELFEKSSYIIYKDEVKRKQYNISASKIIFIRIDPTQTYAYHQGYRSPDYNFNDNDEEKEKISLRTRNQLIKSKRLVSETIYSNFISRYAEYEILLKMDTLSPDWFVYQEPYYDVSVRDMPSKGGRRRTRRHHSRRRRTHKQRR